MKYIAAITLLWVIAITTTFVIVKDAGTLRMLGSVFFMCLVGSILTVRHPLQARPHEG